MKLPGRDMPWKDFFKALKEEWTKDAVSDSAGSLTFFSVLALFPFLLFLVALASVIITPEQARVLVDELGRVAPGQATGILSDRIEKLGQEQNTGLLSVGLLAAIWAASGGLVALARALNTAYDVEESRSFWKLRGWCILLTLFAGVFALAATLAAVAIPPLAQQIGGPLGTALLWLRLPVAAVLMMFLWAVLYWALPDVQQKFRFVSPGAVIGVLIWVLASWGFSTYVRNFGNYDATYGAIGGVIVLLLWMWISAQALLLGAEINSVLEHASPEGKRTGAKSLADTGGDDPTRERTARPGRETPVRRPVPEREPPRPGTWH